jgi:hypothetical protein
MRTAAALTLAAALAAALPSGARARPDPDGQDGWRDIWYLGLGIGSGGGSYVLDGDRVSFRDAHGAAGSPLHLAFQLEAGVTVAPTLLAGGELSVLSSAADDSFADSELTLSQLLGVLTWFPAERGLFLRGGAGLAALRQEWDDGREHRRSTVGGLSVLGGVGYAWWLGRRFNLTLHADLSAQAYGSSSQDPSSSAGVNAYLGFRWY